MVAFPFVGMRFLEWGTNPSFSRASWLRTFSIAPTSRRRRPPRLLRPRGRPNWMKATTPPLAPSCGLPQSVTPPTHTSFHPARRPRRRRRRRRRRHDAGVEIAEREREREEGRRREERGSLQFFLPCAKSFFQQVSGARRATFKESKTANFSARRRRCEDALRSSGNNFSRSV